MSLQTIFLFQIITDLVFCLIIFFLLVRLRGAIDKNKRPVIDPDLFLDLQNLISRSQNDSERFMESLDESCRKLNELSIRLENRANDLTALLKEVDRKEERLSANTNQYPGNQNKKDQDEIFRYLAEGLSAGEIAGRTGLAVGEIELMINLKRLKNEE